MKRDFLVNFLCFYSTASLAMISGCDLTNPTLAKEQGIELATQEVARRGWKETDVLSAELNEGMWEVTLWEVPRGHGNYGVFRVSSDGACVWRVRTGGYNPAAESEITKEKAIEIAKQEMLRRGWGEIEVAGASLNDGLWDVMLRKVPYILEGHATVQIAADVASVWSVLMAGYDPTSTQIERDQAVDLAKREFIRLWGKENEIGSVIAMIHDGRWSVTLNLMPPMPGGHVTIDVSLDGKAFNLIPGE